MRLRNPLFRPVLITVIATLLPAPVAAADGWALCGPPLTPAPLGDPANRDGPDTPTRVNARRVTGKEGRYQLIGDAVINRADRRVSAERMQYQADPARIEASGGVRFEQADAVLTAERAQVNLDDDTGRFSAVSYRIDAGHLHGDAQTVEWLGQRRSRYREVRLSTCNPGEELWWIHADTVTLDQQAGQGTARHAWLSLADVPVFYTPWLRFPLGRDRMTGFLAPSIGRDDEGGLQFATPWYWNIAPNRDATITPTYHGDRGMRLGGEFRYLEPWGGGAVRMAGLPDDDLEGRDRWLLQQEHRFTVGRHFSGALIQRRVSDDDYLDDFGTRFTDDGMTDDERHLESIARASWNGGPWQVSADAQDWQTVDPTISRAGEPFARLPRVAVDYRPALASLPLDFSLETEAVDFDHPAPDLRVTGQRVDLRPRVSLPVRSLGYHFEPAVSWRYTGYRLDDPNGTERTPDREVPVYSLDAGLEFVRDANWLGTPMTQTLEPRLFYLYVPQRDQSDLPAFDTGAQDETLSQLFHTNRFSGPDRVGDANRLTLALTSRWLERRSGRTYLRLSAGQALHFADREVTLDSTPETDDRSDYFTELRLDLPAGLSASANYSWEPSDFGNHDLNARVRWRSGPQTLVNLSIQDRRGEGRTPLEQAEASFAWALDPSWTVLGGWREDLLEKRTSERFLGVAYDSCCYAIRAVHSASEDTGAGSELNNRIMLQFEFKGLGGLGDTLPGFFEEAVPGYRSR